MKFFNTTKYRISMLVVMVMLLQVLMPVVGDVVWAGKAVEVFRVINEEIEDNTAIISWEITLDAHNQKDEYIYDTNFTLEEPANEEELIADDGTELGTYSIDEDGKLVVTIDGALYKEYNGEKLESEEDPDSLETLTMKSNQDEVDYEVTEMDRDEDEGNDLVEEDKEDEIEETEENRKETEEIEENEEQCINAAKVFTGTIVVQGVNEKEESFNDFGVFSAVKDLGDIFKDIEIGVNNDESNKDEDGNLIYDEVKSGDVLEIKEDTTVKLELNWEIDDAIDLKSGDYAELQIPDILKEFTGALKGTLIWGEENKEVGTYTIEDGKLKVTFNEVLEGLSERKGEVWVYLKFNLEKFKEDVTQKIEFGDPINKEYTIIAKPGGSASSITKSGKPNEDINAEYVTWSIDVNTKLENLNNAIVEDTIPDGLGDPYDMVIYDLTVGLDGTVKGEPIKNDELTTSANNKFPVNLGGIDSAYRIEYKTKINEHSKAEYKNIATLKDGGDVKGTAEWDIGKLTIGSSIDKNGKANKNGQDSTRITWTIDVNKAELSLKKVSVEDKDFTEGLTIDSNSIKIYKLKKSGDNWVIDGENIADSFKDINEGTLNFPLNLGDIDKDVYRIVFDTIINYDKYKTTNEFNNKAILKVNGDEKGEALAKVTVNRSTLIEKSGEEKTSYNDPYVKWTIWVNKANQNIKGATITDNIGEGLKLRQDSIKIYDHDGNDVTSSMTMNNKSDSGFTAILGDINTSYRIEYETDITDTNVILKNQGELKGDGLKGEDINNGIIKTPEIVPGNPVNNSYTKTTVDNTTIEGVSYDGLNHTKKTMSWKITVDAKKEKIKNLTIKDEFPHMVFVDNSLVVQKTKDNKRTTLTLKDSELGAGDYSLDTTKAGEFTLTFGELEKAKYEIYFKTSFNPDEVLKVGLTLNDSKIYTNSAKFTGKTIDVKEKEKEVDTGDDDEYIINEVVHDGGKKDGVLTKGNDSSDRNIKWNIYVNALGQDLTGQDKDGNVIPFVITDTISEGQIYDKNTLIVKEYSLEKNGTIIVGSEISADSYTIKYFKDDTEIVGDDISEATKFTLTFLDGIDRPVMVEFNTKLIGISKENYKNTADITGKDLEKTYPKTVEYSKHNNFLTKDAGTDKLYTDDEVNWTLTINESLSNIDAGATIVDNISKGLAFVNNSLTIKSDSASATLEEGKDKDYILNNELNEDGSRTLTIVFNNNITKKYTVEYKTIVVAANGESVSNNASFKGKSQSVGQDSNKKFTVTQYSGGTGSGVRPGSIKITKVDEKTGATISANEAIFTLWYRVNAEDEDEPLTQYGGEGTEFTTNKGELEIKNLPYRTYYLREKKAPNGYEVLKDPIEIVLDNNNKKIEQVVKNTKEKTKITATKVWEYGPEEKPTIYFKLYRQIEGGEVEEVQNAEKKELVNGTTKVEWTDLDKTDIDGNEYKYTVDEVDVPENYDKLISDDGLTITNTYVIPKTEVIATKVWEDGPEIKPTVWFKLYRQILNGNLEEVPGVEIIELPNGITEVSWTGLDKTDIDGNEYTYSVREVDKDGDDYKPVNYEKEQNGLEITNKYVSPTNASAKAIKKWVYGPKEKPTVWFKLYRHIEGGEIEEVPLKEAPIKKLNSGTTEVVWNKLTKTDSKGNEYIFSVKEVDENGNDFTPENYEKSISEDNLTIINTYVIPKTSITATKIWKGGPNKKTTIELQLYRDGEAYGETIELKNGETKYTWTDLDLTDENGVEYKYTIDEVKTPRNYRKSISEDGLTITNTYRPPTEDPYDPKPEDPKPEDPKPEEPKDPEKPEDPETKDPIDPTDPEDPTTEVDGEVPSGGTDVDKEDEDDPLIGLEDNTPKGGTGVEKTETLPKTGENDKIIFYFTGLILITLGFVFRRKTA